MAKPRWRLLSCQKEKHVYLGWEGTSPTPFNALLVPGEVTTCSVEVGKGSEHREPPLQPPQTGLVSWGSTWDWEPQLPWRRGCISRSDKGDQEAAVLISTIRAPSAGFYLRPGRSWGYPLVLCMVFTETQSTVLRFACWPLTHWE